MEYFKKANVQDLQFEEAQFCETNLPENRKTPTKFLNNFLVRPSALMLQKETGTNIRKLNI